MVILDILPILICQILQEIKSILDFFLLDLDQKDIEFIDENLEYVEITSDMLVIDLGENKTKDGGGNIK
jgi:hypothetical protein